MPRGGARSNTPQALKELAGNPGKRPPKAEPSYHVGSTAPAELTGYARQKWRYYEKLMREAKVLTKADRDALAKYCHALGVLEALRQEIAQPTFRYVVVNEAGPKANPIITMYRQWMQVARLYESDLGLNPVSRNRVAMVATEEVDPFDEFDQAIAAAPPRLRAIK